MLDDDPIRCINPDKTGVHYVTQFANPDLLHGQDSLMYLTNRFLSAAGRLIQDKIRDRRRYVINTSELFVVHNHKPGTPFHKAELAMLISITLELPADAEVGEYVSENAIRNGNYNVMKPEVGWRVRDYDSGYEFEGVVDRHREFVRAGSTSIYDIEERMWRRIS